MVSRRSFFTKVLGTAVAGIAAPHLASQAIGYSGGAVIGALPSSFVEIDLGRGFVPFGEVMTVNFGDLTPCTGQAFEFTGVWDDLPEAAKMLIKEQ